MDEHARKIITTFRLNADQVSVVMHCNRWAVADKVGSISTTKPMMGSVTTIKSMLGSVSAAVSDESVHWPSAGLAAVLPHQAVQ